VADFKLEPIPLETIFTGQVFDSNGLPAKGARVGGVVCSNSLEPVVIVTNPEGRFLFKMLFRATVRSSSCYLDMWQRFRDFSIEEGQTFSLNFNLMKAAHKIHGTITNSQVNL